MLAKSLCDFYVSMIIFALKEHLIPSPTWTTRIIKNKKITTTKGITRGSQKLSDGTKTAEEPFPTMFEKPEEASFLPNTPPMQIKGQSVNYLQEGDSY